MTAHAPRVLVIEDDSDIRDLLAWHLRKEGFAVLAADNGAEGIDVFVRERPEVVLLDVMLPGVDGWRVCRQLRAMEGLPRSRIIIVSARTQEDEVLKGLELGADDYVRKPFRPREIVARVRTVLRRRPLAAGIPSDEVLYHPPLTLDHARHEVRLHETPLALTATEYNLLHLLLANPERVFTREQILAQLNLHASESGGRSIDVHVRALRRKLGGQAALIETCRGVGYRFAPPTVLERECVNAG